MPRIADQALPLRHWCVLSLRPRGQHGGLRAAAARHGARTLALSPTAIAGLDDPATRAALRQALAADIVVFTSPNAVATAAALQRLRRKRGQAVLAVGSRTWRALLRHGVEARAPARMDSEGLLAMPELGAAEGRRIGLVTGAGGRGLLAPALRQRGAEVLRVDVYRRLPLELSAHALARLDAALADPHRCLLALSSGEALQALLDALPAACRKRVARIAVVAASARLAQAAHEAGIRRIATATDARPAALMRAAIDAFA
jgi:uroporphyrinogen-III synthase